MVEPHLRVEAVGGLLPIHEHGTNVEWGEARIFEFDAKPGATARIVDEASGREIARWSEAFSVAVDQSRAIGSTAEGLDLYGFTPYSDGTNAGLPSMRVFAAEGIKAFDDLDFFCDYDDQRLPLHPKVEWVEKDAGAQLRINLHKIHNFQLHVEHAEVIACRKSEPDVTVCRYQFSVVPIQGFHLASMELSDSGVEATYEFEAARYCDVEREGEASLSLISSAAYKFKVPLERECEWFEFSTRYRLPGQRIGEKHTRASLALAGLHVEIPDRFRSLATERSICLADVLDAGPLGSSLRITSHGNRGNRKVTMVLGTTLVENLEMEKSGMSEICLYDRLLLFLHEHPSSTEDMSGPRTQGLALYLTYGHRLTADRRDARTARTILPLFSCTQDVGFRSFELLPVDDDTVELRFEEAPRMGIEIRISQMDDVAHRRPLPLAKVKLAAGTDFCRIRGMEVRRLRRWPRLLVQVTPLDEFLGDPLRDLTSSYYYTYGGER